MTTVNGIYVHVCDKILESGGLQSGLWSVQEFLDTYVDVAMDFLQRISLYKKLDAQVQSAGTSQYTWDDWAMDIQAVFSNEKFLFRDTVDDLDASHQGWVGKVGTPRSWHDDQLPEKVSELYPAPSNDGNQVQTSAINGYLGTLAAVTAGDFNITVAAPFYGTISSNAGTAYLETAGPFFGVIASMVESKTNVVAVATATLFSLEVTLGSPVELLHDSLVQYVKWGILARFWSKDGDGKNDFQAKFAMQQYEEGIAICKAISGEALAQEEAA